MKDESGLLWIDTYYLEKIDNTCLSSMSWWYNRGAYRGKWRDTLESNKKYIDRNPDMWVVVHFDARNEQSVIMVFEESGVRVFVTRNPANLIEKWRK